MKTMDSIRIGLLRRLLTPSRVTRSEFAAEEGFRPASVLEAVDELKADGILNEPSRTGAKTGRHSPELALNPEFGVFLGIEVTADRIYSVALDGAGERCDEYGFTPAGPVGAEDFEACVAEVTAHFRELPVRGIALADPGVVDPVRQISLRAVGIPGWHDLPTGEILHRASGGLPVLVTPECAARTAWERRVRAPEFSGSIFHIRLDRGVGAAFWKDGAIFVGDNFRAMEIGHMVLNPGGPLCRCGNRGCLEAIAGLDGIRRRVLELAANRVHTSLPFEHFELRDLTAAVAAGDRPATLLASDIAEQIAPVFAMVAALLNPGLIVISGELKNLGEVLLEPVRRVLKERCLPGTVAELRLELSELDEFAGAHGAARMLFERYLLNQEWR